MLVFFDKLLKPLYMFPMDTLVHTAKQQMHGSRERERQRGQHSETKDVELSRVFSKGEIQIAENTLRNAQDF